MPLTRECLLLNAPGNVRVEPYAASDEKAVLTMYRAGGSGGAFILNHKHVVVPSGELKRGRETMVEARTIDSFGFDAVDLIKLDIQGAEYAALLGARETIRRHRPVILVEEKAYNEEHASYIEKAADLLKSYGMKPKEKAWNDRVYVFAD